MMSTTDFIKGIALGFIVGAAVMFLIAKGIIPLALGIC